jgi:hypothetical protein
VILCLSLFATLWVPSQLLSISMACTRKVPGYTMALQESPHVLFNLVTPIHIHLSRTQQELIGIIHMTRDSTQMASVER